MHHFYCIFSKEVVLVPGGWRGQRKLTQVFMNLRTPTQLPHTCYSHLLPTPATSHLLPTPDTLSVPAGVGYFTRKAVPRTGSPFPMQTPVYSDASLEYGSTLNFLQRAPLLEGTKLKEQWISISLSQLREGSLCSEKHQV